MPKEVIVQAQPSVYHEGKPGTKNTPISVDYEEKYKGFSIGWNKAGWVQAYMFPYDEEHSDNTYIVDLDRININRLINVLRKARDQAYGKDA